MSFVSRISHIAAAALLGCAAIVAGSAAHAEDGPLDITSEALPLNEDDPAVQRVGKRLAYRGGLVLSGEDPRFGGISGLRWLRGDDFLAVTDQGDWLRLTLEEEDGELTGVSAAEIGRLTDERGAPLITKPLADAEALTVVRRDGEPVAAHIYFERAHRGWAYDLGEEGTPTDWTRELVIGDWTAELPVNGGMEAVAGTSNGVFIFPEELRTEDGKVRVRRSRVVDGKRLGSELLLDLPPSFKPTDAHALPGDDILLLSRRFSPLQGVAARFDIVRFVPGTEDRPPALVRRPLALFEPPLAVDNFEALAVRRVDGRTLVYVASDDNFNALQRTLLMKFELLPPRRRSARQNRAPEEPQEAAATTPAAERPREGQERTQRQALEEADPQQRD